MTPLDEILNRARDNISKSVQAATKGRVSSANSAGRLEVATLRNALADLLDAFETYIEAKDAPAEAPTSPERERDLREAAENEAQRRAHDERIKARTREQAAPSPIERMRGAFGGAPSKPDGDPPAPTGDLPRSSM